MASIQLSDVLAVLKVGDTVSVGYMESEDQFIDLSEISLTKATLENRESETKESETKESETKESETKESEV